MNPNHMMNQTVTIAGATGSNDYGETTHGSPTTVRARVEMVNKAKPGANGEMIQVSLIAYVPVDTTVDAGAELTFESVAYKVISINKVPDMTGQARFTELECTEWRT